MGVSSFASTVRVAEINWSREMRFLTVDKGLKAIHVHRWYQAVYDFWSSIVAYLLSFPRYNDLLVENLHFSPFYPLNLV